jgi:hypothetical protein
MTFLDQITDALGSISPNLPAALIILVVGWIAASIISLLIGKALRRSAFGEKIDRMVVGAEDAIELRRWISRIIYYVLLFSVAVAFFQALGLALGVLNELLAMVFPFSSRLFAAPVIALVAWIVAAVLKKIILHFLLVDEGMKQDRTGRKGMPMSQIIAEIVRCLAKAGSA